MIITLLSHQYQWRLWACFFAIRWSHLNVMEERDTQRLFLVSSLLCNLVLVAVTLETSFRKYMILEKESRAFSGDVRAFVTMSGYFALTLIENKKNSWSYLKHTLKAVIIGNISQLIFFW